MANYDTDYDLAILGGGMSSRLAACTAAQKGARVALIAPTWQINDAIRLTLQALCSGNLTTELRVSWASLRDWVHYQCEHPVLSPAVLGSQGIDVILESANFEPELRLRLKNRYLKASRYLLTDGYGLPKSMAGLLPHQLIQLETIPHRIAVIGSGAAALEWAYALSRHSMVTLVLLEQSVLPLADRDIQRLVEAQLRCLGIEIVFSSHGSAMGANQLEISKIDVDLQLVVSPSYDWKTLALENVGIALAESSIPVNRYLQTCCPQLYVSGGSLGGENRTELTQQETTIALKNVLFGRRHVMHYEQAFYSIGLLSSIGCWGVTEHQAGVCYGHGVRIFQASCLPETAENVAQTNFCKLITLGQRIVGVHLVGKDASTLIVAFANRPCLQTLDQWITTSFKPGTLQDAVYQAVEQWQCSRWREGQWRRDWAENWFNFRRSMSM
ncbi:MAG: FAD-dependent oxidoreductase [Cyanobacteria bacterium P01_H01_bin.105]